MSNISQYKTSIAGLKSSTSDQLIAVSKKLASINAINIATSFFASDSWTSIKSNLGKSDYHKFADDFLKSIPDLPDYAIYDDSSCLYDETNLFPNLPSNVKDLLQKVDANQQSDLYTLDGYTMQAVGSTVIYKNNAATKVSIVGPSVNGNISTYNIQVSYTYIDSKNLSMKTETQVPIVLAFDDVAQTLTVTTFPFIEVKGNESKTLDQYTIIAGTYTATVPLALSGGITTSLGSISFYPHSSNYTTMNLVISSGATVTANQTIVYDYKANVVGVTFF